MTKLDLPGLIRRVRRDADLSQRQLAAELGVDQSLVARWETGEIAPSVEQLQRALDLAGCELAVSVARGEAPEPMRSDAVRDLQGRRFPSHLDVEERASFLTGEPVVHAPHRRQRDRLRARSGAVPEDHPTRAELASARAQRHAARRLRQVEFMRAVRAAHPRPPEPPCVCGVGCWLQPGCRPGCPCACEEQVRAGRTLVERVEGARIPHL